MVRTTITTTMICEGTTGYDMWRDNYYYYYDDDVAWAATEVYDDETSCDVLCMEMIK